MTEDQNIEPEEVNVDRDRFYMAYVFLVEETDNRFTLHDRQKNDLLKKLLELFEYLRGEEDDNPLGEWFS